MSKQAKDRVKRRSRFAIRKLATYFYHLKRVLRLKKSLKQAQQRLLVSLKM